MRAGTNSKLLNAKAEKFTYRAIWSEQQRHRLEISISASQDRVSTKDPFLAALGLCGLS